MKKNFNYVLLKKLVWGVFSTKYEKIDERFASYSLKQRNKEDKQDKSLL